MKIKELIELLSEYYEEADVEFRLPLTPIKLNPTFYTKLPISSVRETKSGKTIVITIERIK